MASILGIKGYVQNQKNAVSKLWAGFGNDIVNVTTGLGFGLNLNGNNVEMETYIDRVFLQNFSITPLTSNRFGTAWTNEFVSRCLLSKYIKNYREQARLYLANCKFPDNSNTGPWDSDNAGLTFPSRVFHCDPFFGNTLTWGIEWGRNGKVAAGSPFFELVQPLTQDFKAANIKVGDPLFITNVGGNDRVLLQKPYFVQSIESAYRLRMTENFPVTASSGLHFWVGSNWFDVGTDDGDQLTGIGENVTRALFFKLMSVWYFTGTILKQIKDAPGTSSHRSIISKGGFTYYFHGSNPMISGIYRTDSTASIRVSRAIDPYIKGMSVSNYTTVVGWEEGDSLRWYLGDLTNKNYDISMTKAVATLHIPTGAWDVSPIADEITCATTWIQNGQRDTYLGTADGQVMKAATGYSHNGIPINLNVETKVYYPSGTEVINEFTSLEVIGRQTKGIKLRIRLYDNPNRVSEWMNLGELKDDRTVLEVKGDNLASGFQLGFMENSILENDYLIEKATMFYKPQSVRIIE